MSDGVSLGTPFDLPSFDSGLGQRIIALNIWATRQGLRGATVDALLGGLFEALVEAGVPLSRAFAGMRTLHPQWGGYGYTWRRGHGIEPAQYERGSIYEAVIADSPFGGLIDQLAEAGDLGPPWAYLRRRLAGPAAQLDIPLLAERAAGGATDYFALLAGFAAGDPSRGSGVGYSFETDRSEGFRDDDLLLLKGVLPALSLAVMAQTGHRIAAGLLATYLDRLNAARRRGGKRAAEVDLALHIGEVLYGNVGAADRLDFTVIGPAVNEAARIEALCEPLGARVLVSAELAAAAGCRGRLRPLGRHALRGVREEREIFALELGAAG